MPHLLLDWYGEARIRSEFGRFETAPRPEDKALLLAKWVAAQWQRSSPRWYQRFGQYLYHRRLPAWLRLPVGSLEMIGPQGPCNAAAGMLQFALAKAGIEARQHDLIHPVNGSHSALSARIGGRWIYLDPYLGVAFRDGDQMLSLEGAQRRARQGLPLAQMLTPLRENANPAYYAGLGGFLHAKANDRLEIRVVAKPAVLGTVDGEAYDVSQAGKRFGLTSQQHYLGARFSRAWVKIFEIREPTEITFRLVEDADPDLLPESNFAPEIDGRMVRYAVDCSGCQLILDPADVPWDWLHFRSWLDVDQIIIKPLARRTIGSATVAARPSTTRP